MPHRYFTTDISGGTAVLSGADAHHLAHVMRARPGETVTLCDGKGTDYACAVRGFGPDTVELEILSSSASVSEPGVRVTLYVGYPKQDRLETIVQKAVELGAYAVVPVETRRCVVKLDAKKAQKKVTRCVAAPKKEEQKNLRYNRIAFEAAKQSGRGVVPQVELPVTYKQMLADAARNDAAFFCYEAGGEPLLSRLGGAETIGLITGSEGGFSPEEAAAAREAGCVQIGLGPRILRCETAPLAALAAVMTLTGNLQ